MQQITSVTQMFIATSLLLASSVHKLPSQQNINILPCQKEVMRVENTDPINLKFVTLFYQNLGLFFQGLVDIYL